MMKLSTELVDELTRSFFEERGSMAGDELRESPRTGLVGRGVIIPCPARCGRRPVSVAVRDLSERGVGVIHTQRLEPREQFILHIPASNFGTAPIAVLCTVSNCRALRKGIFAMGAVFSRVLGTNETCPPPPAPAENVPTPRLVVSEMRAVFRDQASTGLTEEEHEQLREVEQRLSALEFTN